MDLSELRAQFPVTRRYAYLNHAAVAPIATPVRRAIDGLTRRLQQRGIAGRPSLFDTVPRLKAALAGMLGGEPSRLALTSNTTAGVLIAANGIPARRGDNVVIAAGEFPANVQPWRALVSFGVQVRTVPETEGRILFADVAQAVDERTAAVAISFVEFATGYRNDVRAIARLCRDADALLVVDGIQGLGALRLRPDEAGIDVLASGAHKWMLACPGIGFAYFSDRALGRLRVADMGWLGVEDPEDFLNYDQPLAEGARRFETGSFDVLGAVALLASTTMLAAVGFEAIQRRVLQLAQHLDARARTAGVVVASPRQRAAERSGIVILHTPWDRPEAIAQRLERSGVVVSARGQGIRVSAHAYNEEEELDRLVELLSNDRQRSA